MTSTNTRTHELNTNLAAIVEHMTPLLYTLNILKDGEEIKAVEWGDMSKPRHGTDIPLKLIIKKKRGGLTLN